MPLRLTPGIFTIDIFCRPPETEKQPPADGYLKKRLACRAGEDGFGRGNGLERSARTRDLSPLQYPMLESCPRRLSD